MIRKSTARLLSTLAVLASTPLSPGCAFRHVKAYSGPDLPKEQLALVQANKNIIDPIWRSYKTVCIWQVDDIRTEASPILFDSYASYVLVPSGLHRFKLWCWGEYVKRDGELFRQFSSDFFGKTPQKAFRDISFRVEQGKRYKIMAFKAKEETWAVFWVEDLETGKLVYGNKPKGA